MKREILKKYIDSWNSIEEYEKSRFYSFEEKVPISGSIQNLDLKFRTEIKMPNIKGIKEELEILKKEITDVVSKKEKAEIFLNNECNCNHEVTICDVETRLNHYADTCVLCGQEFWSSTIHDSGYGIDTIVRKSKKHIVFEGKSITGSGLFGDDYEYISYHTIKEIRDIIRSIVENNTSDDIDLVEEIKNLNLEHCIINNPKNKTLILMIVGSNKFFLDDYSYMSHNYFDDYEKIIRYFKGMYNTVVNVLGSKESLKTLAQVPNSLLLDSYENLSQLETSLNYNKNIPYNLVINMSNLFKYEIKDNKIVTTNYKLNLDKSFKDTPILDIHDLKVLTPDNICDKAKSLIKVRGFNE